MTSTGSSMSVSTGCSKAQRVGNDDAEGLGSENADRVRDVGDQSFEDGPDPVKLLELRRARGVYCGKVAGTKICIDNLGWAFNETQLASELKQHLKGVRAITFASLPVESLSLRAGYGCIEFDSVKHAVLGMIKVESLYLDAPWFPTPRPIMAHFPQRRLPLWGTADVPGYILEHGVCPHFSQPNTLEYDAAVEWRQLQKWLALSKKRLCDAYVKSVCKELIEHRPKTDVAALRAVFCQDLKMPAPRTVVCKGVSVRLKPEQIRNAVEVADYCGNIRRMVCPVSGAATGTVFVEISSAERAASFAEDMKGFLFIMGRSPRPTEAGILRYGPSSGFEGVFDRAVETVFDLQMQQLNPSLFVKAHVVEVSSWKNEKRERSEKIRKILDRMSDMRADWKVESHAFEEDLHVRQKEWIDGEMNKLEKLEKVVPQFFKKSSH